MKNRPTVKPLLILIAGIVVLSVGALWQSEVMMSGYLHKSGAGRAGEIRQGSVAGVLFTDPVDITSPAQGNTYTGTITLSAVVTESARIIAVQYSIDGVNFGQETAKVPFNVNYDTTLLTNGTHTVGAKGRDMDGKYVDASPISFIVNNPVALSISNVSAAAGPTSAVITWITSRPATFQLDYGLSYAYGSSITSAYRSGTQKVTLARLTPKTKYYVRVQAWDLTYSSAVDTSLSFTTLEAAGQSAQPSVTVSVFPSGNPLGGTITLTAYPGGGLSYAGQGTAGYDGAQFLVDGADIGSKVGGEVLRTSFDTTALDNGVHKFSVIIWDKAGNTSLGNTLSLNISNSSSSASAGASWADSAVSKLVNSNGTFYLISAGKRYGITDPGILNSYGFEFKDAAVAASSDLALPQASLLAPGDGSIVKKSGDPTVWFSSSGKKYGFVSADVFLGQGFAWKNVREVSAQVLDSLPQGDKLNSALARHLAGVFIKSDGTIYRMEASARRGIPSMEVYNSWNIDNDFSQVVPANSADLAVPLGSNLETRSFR